MAKVKRLSGLFDEDWEFHFSDDDLLEAVYFYFNSRESLLNFIEQLRQELTRDASTLAPLSNN